MRIAVTGAAGQLGQCLQKHQRKLPKGRFVFLNKNDLDISSEKEVSDFFRRHPVDYCINCAAYTAVDQAEDESEKAFLINGKGTKNIAENCAKNGTTLFHISTDYVFDGTQKTAYTETDIPRPINVYGESKHESEKVVQKNLDSYFILRTSWVYSEFGRNFYKTMKNLILQNRADLKVTTEETGTPTNANDIALLILDLIAHRSKNYGLYHFTNAGSGTWFDFAREIYKNLNNNKLSPPQPTDHFETRADRPKNSVLSTEKITNQLGAVLINWKSSLRNLQNSDR